MKPKTFMLIAGEASGDLLAAELVEALRTEMAGTEPVSTADYQPLKASLEPQFFGAGGPLMAKAGVNLAFDMTRHSVIGISDVLKNFLTFHRLFRRLFELALDHQPDAIICVDFSGFNRRFAHAIKQHVRAHLDWFHDWDPKIIQYVSPQVWASREGRAYQMAKDYDLLLVIFPFEKDWYAKRVPQLKVEFVGHPMMDRYAALTDLRPRPAKSETAPPAIVLLPGSRPAELTRHLPVMFRALRKLQAAVPGLRSRMVLPHETLAHLAKSFHPPDNLAIQVRGLPAALAEAELAIASTGTVTMECAYFGVPTIALYKTSWSTYQVAKRIVSVPYLAMPNLLADKMIVPEFVQNAATAEKIAGAALELLQNKSRRQQIKDEMAKIIGSLGAPGANRRAARTVCHLV